MTLNFCQLIILIGLIQGFICLAILSFSKELRTKENTYLSLLILSFLGNVLIYWLRDMDFIHPRMFNLIFIPWQILIPPLFLLYVKTLRIFDQKIFPNWSLFVLPTLILVIHLVIKVDILAANIYDWSMPKWVRSFFLIEEYISMFYGLFAAIVVYRLIRKERKRNLDLGFGINKVIVKWIRNMVYMGIAIAVVWTLSLNVLSSIKTGSHYVLWISMVFAAITFGVVGIYTGYKHGKMAVVDIVGKESLPFDELEAQQGASEGFFTSTPQKHLSDQNINGLMSLSARMAKSSDITSAKEVFIKWIIKEYRVEEAKFIEANDGFTSTLSLSENERKLRIPFVDQNFQEAFIDLTYEEVSHIKEEHLYDFKIATEALHFQLIRIQEKTNYHAATVENENFRNIINQMENEEVFKDPNLDLQSLASIIDISHGYLSKLINEVTGKSFNDFINGYRVNLVKKLMVDPEYDHYTIIGYGLEAGFNSKSTFYKAFRKKEKISPGEYLKNIKSRKNTSKLS